jgi:hypothetical protein
MAENKISTRAAFKDDTSAGVAKMNKSMQAGFKKSEKSSKALTSGFKKLAMAAGGLFVFAKVVSLVSSAAKAFDVQMKAEARLNNVLATTGNVVNKTTKQLIDMAGALQKVTLFGDEAVMGAQGLMLTFTNIGEDIFPDAIKTVLDMSTAFGQDLKGAAIQLGKALDAPITGVGALAEVGVSFSEDQKAMIKTLVETGKVADAQRIILDSLAVQVGGAAEAAAEAGTGGFTQMTNSLSNIGEKVAAVLVPAMEGMAKWITENDKLITAMIIGPLAGWIGAMKFLWSGLLGLIEILAMAAQGFVMLAGMIPKRLLPKGWAESIDSSIESIDAFRLAVKKMSEDTATSAVKNFKVAGDAMKGLDKTASEIAKELGGSGVGLFTKKEGSEAAKKEAKEAKEAAEKAAKEAADAEKKKLSAIADIRKQFADLQKATRQSELDDLDKWYMEQSVIAKGNGAVINELFEIQKAKEKEITERYDQQKLEAIADIRKEFADIQKKTRQDELAELDRWYMEQSVIAKGNGDVINELYEVQKARKKEITERYDQQELEAKHEQLTAIFEIGQEFEALKEETMATELENLKEWYAEKAEIISTDDDASLEAKAEVYEAQSELYEVFLAREAEIKNKYDEKKKAQNKKAADDYAKIQAATLSVASGTFGAMSDLLTVAGGEQKKYAEAAKAMAIIQTTIDTFVGAQRSYNALSGLVPAGPVLGAIAAAAAVAGGLARVAKISGLSFEEGGIYNIIPGTSYTGDKKQVGINSREGVFTLDQQRTLFDIAAGRTQASGGQGIENLNVNIYGDATEETTEDLIEKIDNLLEEREYSGIVA